MEEKNKGDGRALIIEVEENFRYLRMVAFDAVPLSDVVESLAVDEYKRLVRNTAGGCGLEHHQADLASA